ncbi:transcriptional regulator, AsnC family protein [Ketogulonicigenium vulgare Y25]|uniref:Transcriptional regulator, AsnC family protein n=2 Tax=Ketogulonicigenium vulgare TaxID=92945 RepID=F9Y3K4_KETVW|nr:transcriptional regulator, AsnC family protein [Ketogulonicigenium vulgare Y25]AEM41624.1 transcriptional regulator, AsnC family protein [Ketogulonicigenium vulgare WSH-001]ALJ81739.1 AsnC family transcriptional regulator [Ketogulonicigenium vulgare]ANW34402.1 AsnC family transcriptional regulator [Ketogulonicigenium vulgare]AOZ55374.1 transcriptional regulator, AsnC family protein [Ketogulonicigenium vulgare]
MESVMSVDHQETDSIRQIRHRPADLDAIDRKILGALAVDASSSYAELSRVVNLSAPAVHDRVKRLKRDGVIKSTVAVLDGCKLGRTLLTFLVVDTSSYSATRKLLKFTDRPEVEELHTVAGDGCVLIKVRAVDTEGLESFLMEIQSLEGVRSVRSYITLSTFIERGPAPE